MDPAFDQLRSAASRWTALDGEQWARFARLFTLQTLDRREHFALPGSAAHDVLFVSEGLLRFYYPGDEGKESNKAFVGAGEFAGALAAANLGVPLLYGVEALEPTRALVAPYADFAALMDGDATFERLGRKLAELILTRKERRTRSMLLRNASERWADFVASAPDLVQRVPQYHIASYLGITEVHLSRIRGAHTEAS